MEDEMVMYLCARVEDMPKPIVPSSKKHCSECRAEIWIDKNLLKTPHLLSQFLCTKCAQSTILRA